MASYKLGVEVVGAHDLIPKDGQGAVTSFVELLFEGQKFRSTVKEKDVKPIWNELFYFNVSDPSNLHHTPLEAFVYHLNRATSHKHCIGKVRIAGSSFVPFCDAVVLYYPLEKPGLLSRVRGELGLKVFLTDDPSIKPSNPLPAIDPFANAASVQSPAQIGHVNHRSGVRHFFRSIGKEFHEHHPSAPVTAEHVKWGSEPLPAKHAAEVSAVKYNPEMQLKYAPNQLKVEPPRIVRMFSATSQQSPEYALKETSPHLGGGMIVGGRVLRSDRPTSTYDLVERMHYIFVHVVKAKELPSMDITGSLDPFVEVKVGNYKGTSKRIEKNQNPVWNDVFAFSRDFMQASTLEVVVKDKNMVKDDFVGMVRFDLNDVPTRVPPDSPLAPEWYRLADKRGEKVKGELMLAVWIGTQADEAFPEALHSDAAAQIDASAASVHIKSKIYHAPRLWYVRVGVIEAQDIALSDKTRLPDLYVKGQLGNQVLCTRTVKSQTANPLWNEVLMFVAAEPFEDHLIVSVEDRVAHNKHEVLGLVKIPLASVEKRADDRVLHSKWFGLERPAVLDVEQLKKDKFSSRLHVHVCLDGGYHVLDESTHYSSDLRPTAKQLWKPSIGLLELGILDAVGIHPMKTRDGKGTSDTYCVAKYGHKWVRTRTVVNSLHPRFNEQYTWEVYDPATVLTVGVFDNCQLGEKNSNGNKDSKIGKVRIRLSTLETGRVYTHSYPLLVLHPSGLKKMGEIHLAIRFSSTSFLNMMSIYSKPLLPKMHYIRPLTILQLDMLRNFAVQIVAARLGRMEPPLRKEVVEYMSDADSHFWSMRRSKANFFRLMTVFSGFLGILRWFRDVCTWRNPITAILVHVLFLLLVCFPELILPTLFLYMFMIGLWNYRYRPHYPPHMNTKLSHADSVFPDELDEEFDTFPSSRSPELVKARYDRLRHIGGKVQTIVGDIATQGERLQALLSWRDPRATSIFTLFCLLAAIVLYVTPTQVIVAFAGFYTMRHPRFRSRTPSAPLNFFRRLPARTDSML